MSYLDSYDLFQNFEDGVIDNFFSLPNGNLKKNFNTLNFCPICLIKKKHKVRHVKEINLCVKDFYFYSKIFDKLVFYKNLKEYIVMVLFNLLAILLEFVFIYEIFHIKFHHSIFLFPFEFFILDMSLILKIGLIFNFYIAFEFSLTLFLIFVATYYGLTYDELLNAEFYPYLYYKVNKISYYKNPNNKGFVDNFIRLLK